jgi:tetratricopeptide (TPR) repeat protein
LGSAARRGADAVRRRPSVTTPPERSNRPPDPQSDWQQVDEGSQRESGRLMKPARVPERLPADLRDGLRDDLGEVTATRVEAKLLEARRAFDRDRYAEARSVLTPIARRVPTAAAVRELLGLTNYRMGNWKQATAELEAYRSLTGAVDQHPVLMDCERAQQHWGRVDELWAELKAASPSAPLVAEGRIVAAGAKADRGDLRGALRELHKVAVTPVKRPQEHHLRQWYVLGDLNERLGELPAARAWFRQVRDVDPDFADVADRVRRLR